MAIRRWAVRPDEMLTLHNGEQIAVCSREAMREAFLDGEAMMAQAGGVFSVLSFRARTDVDGEMVTISAVCEWKDRANAKPQPEPEHRAAPLPPEDEEIADADLAAVAAELAGEGDGAAEPDEDMSSIPAHLQGAV